MFEMFENFAKENDAAYEKPMPASTGRGVFVVSVGGSIFFDNPPDTQLIGKLAAAVSALSREGHKIVLGAGGGKTARNYVVAGEQFNATKFELDKLGIAATRINAQLIINALENPCDEVLTRVEDAAKALDDNKVPVFGGLLPSFTTDAVAALIAESLDATFLNLTNVDGIYSSDPNKSKGAEFFDEISYESLVEMIVGKGSTPGQNLVLDLPCCLILQRSNLKGIVLDGNDLGNFERAVRGEQFRGTIVGASSSQASHVELPEKPRKRATPKKPVKSSSKKKPERRPNDSEFTPQDVYKIDFGRR